MIGLVIYEILKDMQTIYYLMLEKSLKKLLKGTKNFKQEKKNDNIHK